MNRTLVIVIALTLLTGVIFAETMTPGPQKATLPSPPGRMMPSSRVAPEFTFSVAPTPLIHSYYDYMVGGYNSFPLRRVPEAYGGGSFITFMGKRTPTGTRRQFWAYVDNSGTIQGLNEITNAVNNEGFGTLAIDPLSGKPIYLWHAVHPGGQGTTENDVQYTSDAFLDGIPGLLNEVGVAVDNPTTITAPNGTTTTDNEFIWPGAVVGPSPVAGKRRVYVETRNSISHTLNPSGNILIAMADFDANDIELGIPFQWTYTQIPELDNWNTDQEAWRRPFNAMTVDQSGNVYYVGYHVGQIDEVDIDEPDLDVFVCDNYGQGNWRRLSIYSHLSTWNPLDYFEIEAGIPYEDDQLYWGVTGSGHLNAIVDNSGKVRFPALWALINTEGTYWPAFHFLKEGVFDPNSEELSIREIYPISENPDDYFQPWDLEEPWGEVDEVDDEGYPLMVTDWPFPYWDDTVHENAMIFHYNGVRYSGVNQQDMMACVWQNSYRARMINSFQLTEYEDYSDVPEIYISVSPDNGGTWSEPIVINKLDTPGFTDIKPMWVYPADQIKYVSTVDGHKIGRLGLLFMDDVTWGSNVQQPPVHTNNDGGRIMYTELEITFPLPGGASEDPILPPSTDKMLSQNYPNPFNPETTISFTLPNSGKAELNIYNVKGQLVKTLISSELKSGSHSVVWNGTDELGNNVASGMYFYRLNANGRSESKKMLLMK